MREKDSSDYDLERFIDMFDQALISDDIRVKNALRQLMMMVILTSEDHEDQDKQRLTGRAGPMRRMQEDMRDISRALSHLRDDVEQIKRENHRQTKFNFTTSELNDIQVRISQNINGGKK